MSIDNHPNVNAVSLMLEIQKAIMNNMRGRAEVNKKAIEFDVMDLSRRFAIEVSEYLDGRIGIEEVNENRIDLDEQPHSVAIRSMDGVAK